MTSVSATSAQAATDPLLLPNPHKPTAAKGLKGAHPLPALTLSKLPHSNVAASAAASAAQFAAHAAEYHQAKGPSKAPVVAVHVDCRPFAPKGRSAAIDSIVATQPMFGATLHTYNKADGLVIWNGPRVIVFETAEMLCTAEAARAAPPQSQDEHFQYMDDLMNDFTSKKAQ